MLADVCLSSVPVGSRRFSLTTHLLVLALCGAPSLDIAGHTFPQDLLLPPNTGTTLGVSYNAFSPRNPRNINANHHCGSTEENSLVFLSVLAAI